VSASYARALIETLEPIVVPLPHPPELVDPSAILREIRSLRQQLVPRTRDKKAKHPTGKQGRRKKTAERNKTASKMKILKGATKARQVRRLPAASPDALRPVTRKLEAQSEATLPLSEIRPLAANPEDTSTTTRNRAEPDTSKQELLEEKGEQLMGEIQALLHQREFDQAFSQAERLGAWIEKHGEGIRRAAARRIYLFLANVALRKAERRKKPGERPDTKEARIYYEKAKHDHS
jgi:hypothetical protein